MKKRITPHTLYNTAISYLQRFPTSIPHFKKMMQRKIDLSCKQYPDQDLGSCHSMLEELIENLCRKGILNDELYLEGRINSLRQKGTSSRVIQCKMQQKRLPSNLVDISLQENEADDLEACMIYIKRKKLLQNEPIKQMASLARAGFSYDVAKAALQKMRETTA